MYYISYLAIVGSIWLIVGVCYLFFVMPVKLVVKAIRGDKPQPKQSRGGSAYEEHKKNLAEKPSTIIPILDGAYSVVIPHGSPYEHITFKVKGVTFDNEDGKSRQDIIKSMEKKLREFEDGVISLMSIEKHEYEGKPAFAILANGMQIGNVPADLAEYLDGIYNNFVAFTVVNYLGGGRGESYGVQVTLRFNKSNN